jgi:hypothetical protein
MPRGDPSIWQQHGASYTQLSAQATHLGATASTSSRPDPSTMPAAGSPSNLPFRGSGSFVAQVNRGTMFVAQVNRGVLDVAVGGDVPQAPVRSGLTGPVRPEAATAHPAWCDAGGELWVMCFMYPWDTVARFFVFFFRAGP